MEGQRHHAGLSVRQRIGLYIYLFSAGFPALIVNGFFPDANVLSFWQWAAIASVGGAIAGAIFGENGNEEVTAIAGFVSGFCCLPALMGYVHMRDMLELGHTYSSVELLIPFGYSMVPGWCILILFKRHMRAQSLVPSEEHAHLVEMP